jgi:DNA-binding CsgD family transcriptional regulator
MAVRRRTIETRARERGSLSPRERECLELVARGKSDWAIGRILRISQHTVHRHIESAKRRLGVSTRIQAIVYALYDRQISLVELARSPPRTLRRKAR